ncbi:dUTPase-domain-containing protein, partial [Aulographum hederae CBS 113979]
MASERSTPAIAHEPPSLPASPLPKRTKVIDPVSAVPTSIANGSRGTDTPTPMASESLPSNPLLPTQVTAGGLPVPALEVKFLSETAKAPTRGSAFAAGYDLYSSKESVIPARGKALIDTDISIAVPPGTYGRVAPRSGLASKHSID